MNFDLKKIFEHFGIDGQFVLASPYGDGHINDTFVTIVERGSMVAAAKQLHISPAAVAQQIKC